MVTLHEAIQASGMTPPLRIPAGRFVRFPGAGKGRANRSGWCRKITEQFAVFGDWSTGLVERWSDGAHHDEAQMRRVLAEARERERIYARQQAKRAGEASRLAVQMIAQARQDTHPYLIAKGFKHGLGLVLDGELLIPIRSVDDHHVISIQTVAANGTKKFLPGGRTKGGVYRIGPRSARQRVLCEGYATGLSIRAAMDLLSPSCEVVVCFSAMNLVAVAPHFPGAIVAADNDASKAGEDAAVRTGLPWVMPPEVGEDFNDFHRRAGLIRVVETLRGVVMK